MKILDIYTIFVPAYDNDNKNYSLEYHQMWDRSVIAITGGLTLKDVSKGKWLSDNNRIIEDKMIAVQIGCISGAQLLKVVALTMTHYNQDSITVIAGDKMYIYDRSDFD